MNTKTNDPSMVNGKIKTKHGTFVTPPPSPVAVGSIAIDENGTAWRYGNVAPDDAECHVAFRDNYGDPKWFINAAEFWYPVP